MVWGSHGGIDDRPHQEIAQKDKPGTRLVAKTVGEKVSRSMERGSGDTMRISLGRDSWARPSLGRRAGQRFGARGCDSMSSSQISHSTLQLSWSKRRYIPSSDGSGGQGARPCGVRRWNSCGNDHAAVRPWHIKLVNPICPDSNQPGTRPRETASVLRHVWGE